jgi:AcrR family transcriptional regulator
MTEPRTDRGRDAKGRILTAAATLMYERGVAAARLDDILAASGTGKSQFYHYFTSKEDLVGAVLHHQLDRILNQQQAHQLDTWDGLTAWFEATTTAHETSLNFHGCPLGSIANEVLEQGEPLRRQAIDAFARWEAALANALLSMQARGLLRGDADPPTLAETTIAIMQGGYLLSAVKRDSRPMRNALTAALAHLRSAAPAEQNQGTGRRR